MTAEHPFAAFIRALGKGPNTARPLTRAEARAAFGMVLASQISPVQLGAFLCLIRVMTETPDELAGFAEAARATLTAPEDAPDITVDWPSYAGKKRRLPWYLLSAQLLGQNGVTVFMHGHQDPAEGRLHAGSALRALGVPACASLSEAGRQIALHGFAYMPLDSLSPALAEILALRPLLGLRSPVHTVVRTLNPFNAPCQVIGVAHPPYRALHRDAARLLGQAEVAIFKGEGGEAERRPEKPCDVATIAGEENWPALTEHPRAFADDGMDTARLAAVWQGRVQDPIAAETVIGTAAIVLKATGRAVTQAEAMAQAAAMWAARRPLAVAA
jgi:anthranilate phosphoribosyltransferase